MNPRIAMTVAILATLAAPAAAADALWESRPYRIEIDLDLSASGLDRLQAERLQQRFVERVRNRVGRFWELTFAGAAADSKDEEAASLDKRIVGRLSAVGGERVLELVEEDLALGDRGVPVRIASADAVELPELLFRAITAAFRPIARFQRDPQEITRVNLSYRGAELAPGSGVATATPGSLMLPYRIRLDRDGRPAEGGVTGVKWTYLVTNEAGDGPPSATVASHSRRPFGARPSGRIEQLAIAAPADPNRETVLHLHVIDKPDTPLPGYEVFLGEIGSMKPEPLGYSGHDGRVPLPPTDRVRMAHVKCGGLFVASLPYATGVEDEILVPLIDERTRLRAELEVNTVRERLIDTVARRKILGERIKRLLDEERIDDARRMLANLEELPGRTQLASQLDQAERSVESVHPVAKQRIDKLFLSTRQLLNAALDPRELRDVSLAVERARQGAALR